MSLAPFSTSLLLFFHLFFHVALATKSRNLRRLFFIPIALILWYLLFHTTIGYLNEDWLMGHTLMTELFTASDYLVLTDAHRELRLTGQKESISDASFGDRMKWAQKLTLSPRGVGWTHEPRSAVRPPPPYTRREFAMRQIGWSVYYCALFKAIGHLNHLNPSFAMGSPGLDADGWAWRFVCVMSFTLALYACGNVQITPITGIFVALGSWEPSECPPMFGSFAEAYTLRKFWGGTWHQLLRRFLATHGKFVTHRVLGLRKGGKGSLSAYVQLFVAFTLSGILHQTGEYMMTRAWSGGSFRFFVLQAIAITFEDHVIAFAKNMGLRSERWRLLGYVYVLAWFTWSVPIWLNAQVAAGLMDTDRSGGFTTELVTGQMMWKGPKIEAS